MKQLLGTAFLGLTSFMTFAQEAVEVNQEKALGLDEKINNWFAPIADKWEHIVLYPISFTETISVPIVVLLLVLGALFFTLRFSFINIRKFPLAINVVRGKYDDVDDHGVEKSEINIQDGDILDTIRDESKEGEVSHFQALATAVSGTVGFGEYCWCSSPLLRLVDLEQPSG